MPKNKRPKMLSEAQLHVRLPSGLLEKIQTHAQRFGLSASAWIRLVALDAIERNQLTATAASKEQQP